MSKARFQVITVFPEMIENITMSGVVGQARKKGLVDVSTINPRAFTADVHQTVDDRPFGGGDGMVMLTEPLEQAILAAKQKSSGARCIYLSPQGRPLKQNQVIEYAKTPDLILLCGRYSGVDQRLLRKHVDEEVSLGDYVISGGELAASVLIDAVSRFVPGVLGHAESATADSFTEGLLEAPLFTRPREIWGMTVPDVLLSGHHAKILGWQKKMSYLVTQAKRPDLDPLKGLGMKQLEELKAFFTAMSSEEKSLFGLTGLSEEIFNER